MKKHYIYKYVFDNEIIYIGKTSGDLSKRLSDHGKLNDNIEEQYWDMINQSEIYFIELDSGIICDIAETLLINQYKPRCNKAKIIDNFDKYHIIFDEKQYKWCLYNKIGKLTINTKLTSELEKENAKLNDELQLLKKQIINHQDYISLRNAMTKGINYFIENQYMTKEKYIEIFKSLMGFYIKNET